MTSADAMRASDGDRERVVQALQEQVGEGRLTLVEFEQRTSEAYAATTIGDLRALTKDLPVDPLAPALPAVQHPWQQPYPLPAVPPWAQRPFPARFGRPPVRRVHPLAIAGGVFLTMFLIQAVVGVLAWTTGMAMVPVWPLIIVAFVLLRIGRRRRYR